MNLNLDTNGFRSIANSFDLFFIDIWGVIHNGISIFEDSINVLDELDKLNKEYVLLTNAPRPNDTVKNFLIKMGLEKIKSEKVFSSIHFYSCSGSSAGSGVLPSANHAKYSWYCTQALSAGIDIYSLLVVIILI